MKRFKAGNVRVVRAHGVAAAVQEVEGLKRVARALRCSGLVQVDEGQRTFGMHQLLQQAVGRELGWGQQCERMQQLLQARCGHFGDEEYFDVGLYSVMREVVAAAVGVIERVRREGNGQEGVWCSSMLLRLYDVARAIYGTGAEFTLRIISAAHSSLVGELLREQVMTKGCTSAGRSMTLRQLVDAAPHLRDVVAMNPNFKFDEDDHRAFREEMAKGASRHVASDIIRVRRFDFEKCLGLQWGRRWRALLLAGLVRAVVRQAGGTSARMQEVAAVALVQELVGLGEERDLGQLLREAAGLRVVGDDVIVEAEGGAEAAVGWSDDGGASGAGRGLRAMRWRLHTLTGHAESRERMMDEIGGVHGVEAEAGDKWAAGVALGAACQSAAYVYNGPETLDKKIAAYERAVRMRLDALGEQHPDTAATLASIGTAYSDKGNYDMAIMLRERALRILKDALGQHPTTAKTMSNIGVAYGNKGQHKKAIELHEQALRIYERTVGRMHRKASYAISCMSSAYYNLGDLVKAEELGKEALVIREKTLGPDHELTKEARDGLDNTQKAKSRGGGALK